MKKKIEKPKCFKPEENVAYPLCVGNGSEQCQECQLWVDYPDFPTDIDFSDVPQFPKDREDI